MTVAATGSSAKRSWTKVRASSSMSVPTMGARVSHRGGADARARALSGLRELRGAVLPQAVHGRRRRLVLARRCAADIPRRRDRREDRRLARATRWTAADARVPGLRQEDAPVHDLRKASGALPDVRLPRRRPRRVASASALRPRAPPPDDRDAREVERDLVRLGLVGRRRGDRKSTRLNSSHVAISYAVFCL